MNAEILPRVSGSVLKWLVEPVNATEVCLGSLPSILATLIGELNCRVLIGCTEDLTAMVLRVYSEDMSLALFPRSAEDWSDVEKWASGPSVLEDVRRHGEVVDSEGRRRRRHR